MLVVFQHRELCPSTRGTYVVRWTAGLSLSPKLHLFPFEMSLGMVVPSSYWGQRTICRINYEVSYSKNNHPFYPAKRNPLSSCDRL